MKRRTNEPDISRPAAAAGTTSAARAARAARAAARAATTGMVVMVVTVVTVVIASGALAQSIATTKHNLSTSGPGTIKATTETEICKFCHTPHNASVQAPLWNRADPGGTYTMYWSPTMDAYPSAAAAPQPNGSTKLCLSCHDGSIALGATLANGTIGMSGGITTMPVTSSSYFGRDLSGHHPISFTVTTALISANNAKDSPLKTLDAMRAGTVARLDRQDRVQCASCHDPHRNPYNNNFLRAANEDSICLTCHG